MEKIAVALRRNFPLILVIFIAALLRLYRISDYMTFLGDEGRDALVWLRMMREGKFTLIGPQTSIGNMYLGPLYYYLMLPFFILFRFSPIGPAAGVAFFGVATVFLIWWVGREWFSEKAGLIAAFLFATSPVVIIYSRSSWNPNVMPFFALLVIYGTYQFWRRERFIWLPIMGITLSFALQSHYLGLLLIPVVGIFWLLRLLKLLKGSEKLKSYVLYTTYSILIFFVLTIVPLIWFDLRHNFINSQAFLKFFSDRQTTVNFKAYKAIPNLWPLWQLMITRLVSAGGIVWGKAIAIGLILGMVVGLLKKDKNFIFILIWLVIGLVGMGLYKQHIYDHYFGFIFPAPFLLTGFILSRLWDVSKITKFFAVLFLGCATYINLASSPLRQSPNYQAERAQEVDKKIAIEAAGKPYNLALIAKQNYDAGYWFYLELWGKKPVAIDPQRAKETITDQLFVVCEDPVCEPINHPRAEIANFGWVKIKRQWEFPWGVKLIKLQHNE
ncbi:phospholipid carrier-dependent glycosyltransferase [Candidatus Shapirobacteria bacterium]|nr:phospholipid carrier-dependent glycosyltransferase [Candidatus Shapirobacteria bacterium]